LGNDGFVFFGDVDKGAEGLGVLVEVPGFGGGVAEVLAEGGEDVVSEGGGVGDGVLEFFGGDLQEGGGGYGGDVGGDGLTGEQGHFAEGGARSESGEGQSALLFGKKDFDRAGDDQVEVLTGFSAADDVGAGGVGDFPGEILEGIEEGPVEDRIIFGGVPAVDL